MDQRRKWILVDSSIPRSPDGNRKRVVEVYASPSSYDPSTSYHRRPLPSHPSESKIHSLNRLNDRIHRKIAANSFLYSSTSSHIREEDIERPREERREEGERIVDESFRFIDDSNIYASSSSRLPPPHSLNRLVQHRDSQGEIDAVYERKPPQPDRGASLVADLPQSSSQWRHSMPRPLAPDPPSPSKIPARTEKEWYQRGIAHEVPITLTRDRLRREIMDERIDHPTLPRPVVDHSPRRIIDHSPRRAIEYSHYHTLCPYCSNPIHSGATHCPVCGAVNSTPLRRLGKNYEYFPPTTSTLPPPSCRYARSHSAPDYVRHTPHVTVEPYYKRREEILNPRTLNRDSHYWATKRPVAPQSSTLLRQSRVADPIYRNYGTGDWRRKTYGDMDYHNYPGYNMHRSYYRYGHVKPRRSRGHTQRKAVAFALALLSLALVISAGVVLAAINY
ncbi:hypothetical protein PENTCL1PPCAC_26479 [Pristionchus entomophagus]|uniref:Uncharacterized protein n=1 Tax=Pristionchus entomophagus TaxID=358040 RepID=A0AAV5UDT4_9BILA|nr:hypothetical protein PENTCL1PPCAC_26479 [Pristionchus entomophagus]